MSFGLTLQALMRLAQVALASILLVGVPLADAAICASEERSGSIEASDASLGATVTVASVALGVGEHDSRLPGDAEHCIHGHCHHSPPFKDGESHVRVMTVGATCVAPLRADMVLTHVSAGLERPPKT